ncbi:YdbH domain-containing protein [Sediminicurvatus halobius]|uniref:Uncharacterized protein n=1 Tax=Sediminicurvatus halobius TaxID=2182432 RepID=A0A2U2MYK0_9GAMM|nr:YdbH domain-containing protein [Spiribacter halobius]PWG61872.1 hypothetical protein DEM34_14160 [Spiribacter halobius]UEX79254.1 YdbH domain-containing protein [Spiribacter halobius]
MRTLLWLGLLAGFALAAAAFWRTDLAEAAVHRWLASAGFPEAAVSVAELGWTRTALDGVDLGPGAPEAGRVVITYRPAGLIAGQLVAVEVHGLRVPVQPGARRPLPWLPSRTRAAATSPGTAAARLPPLPVDRVRIVQGRLDVTAYGESIRVGFDADLDATDGSPRLSAEGVARAAGVRLRFQANTNGLTRGSTLAMTIDGEVSATELAWPAELPGRPDAGRVRLRGEYRGRVPEALSSPVGLEALTQAELDLELAVASWRVRGLDASASGRLALRSAAATPGLDAHVLEPLVLTGSPSADVRAFLPLPDGLASALAGMERLVLQEPAGADGPLLALRPSADGWRSDWRARLRAEQGEGRVWLSGQGGLDHGRDAWLESATAERLEIEAQGLRLGAARLERLQFAGSGAWSRADFHADAEVQGRLSRSAEAGAGIGGDFQLALRAEPGDGPDTARVFMRESGRLRLTSLPPMAGLRLSTPITVELLSGEGTLREGVWTGRLRVAPGAVSGLVTAGEGDGQAFRSSPGVIELVAHHAGTTALRLIAGEAAVQLSGPGIELGEVAVDVAHAPPRGLSGSIELGRISHQVSPPAFAPLRVAARLSGDLDRLRLEGEAGALGHDDVRVPLQLRHDAGTGEGELVLGPGSLVFRPRALTPADLVPRLGVIEEATGELRLEGRLAWGAGPPESRLTLELSMAELQAAGVGVQGLETALELTGLPPVRSAPDQRLSIRELRAGVPVTDIRGRFRLLDAGTADGAPALDVAELEADFAGGSLRLADARFRLGQPAQRATIEVREVALERLLPALGLGEDVRGEGRLSGRIPVRLDAEGVAIAEGELQAREPGRLQVRLRETGQALARQAQEMELMIRALEDFRYEVLAADLERDPDGELRLGLQLEGSNPDVLEGHPFRFNITLSGNLDPVFRALRLGGDIGAGFLQEHLRLR